MKSRKNISIRGILTLSLLAGLSFPSNAKTASTGTVTNNEISALSKKMSLEDFSSILKQGSFQDTDLAQLSPAARKQLISQVRQLKREQSELLKGEEEKSSKLKIELRNQRRKIQEDRLKTFGPMDERAKKRLFANLLDQANIDARKQSKKLEIEERYMITVNFQDTGSALKVVQIAAGERSLWTNLSHRQIAKQD